MTPHLIYAILLFGLKTVKKRIIQLTERKNAMFDYSKEQILSALNSHSKELIRPTEEKRLRIKDNPLLSKSLSALDRCRDFYRDQPLYSIPFSIFKRYEADGDRTEYEYSEKGYFRHRGHLETWVIAAWLYQEKKDITMLEDTIWAICDEYTWALPAHMSGKQGLYACLQEDRYTIDLFAAETGDTISEALLMLEDKLDPILVKRARRELEKRIFSRYQTGLGTGDFWWEKSTNNWSAVCAGSVGMAAMCGIDDNERLADIIFNLLSSMRYFMSGFAADGSCLEGTGYWSYGFGYFASFADMLYRRTGGEIDLFNDESVHKVALFPQKTFFYGSRTVSFSDAGSYGGISLGMTYMLMQRYQDVKIPATANISYGPGIDGCHRFALTFHDYLWTPEKLPEESTDFEIYPLPAAQWFIGSGKDRFGFAAKAGNNNEPHNHNDVGNFITYKDGEEFFCDLGSGEYSKQYFDNRTRYTFPHCGSQGHSVPIINGNGYQKAGHEFAASDVTVNENGISMDMAPAYGIDTVKSLRRSFTFDKYNAVVKIKDEFDFSEKPSSLVERFITKLKPEITDGEIILKTQKNSMSLYYDKTLFDAAFEPCVQPDHGGNPFTFYYIDLTAKEPGYKCDYEFEIR